MSMLELWHLCKTPDFGKQWIWPPQGYPTGCGWGRRSSVDTHCQNSSWISNLYTSRLITGLPIQLTQFYKVTETESCVQSVISALDNCIFQLRTTFVEHSDSTVRCTQFCILLTQASHKEQAVPLRWNDQMFTSKLLRTEQGRQGKQRFSLVDWLTTVSNRSGLSRTDLL